MLKNGHRVVLSYPDTNSVSLQPKFRDRRLEVISVRDLVDEPLTPAEFFRRPHLRRSRWLVTATDLDTKAKKQFYLGASREFESPGVLRIGLYAPGEKKPIRLIGPQFLANVSDLNRLAQVLKLLLKQPLADLELKIFSDDLRLIE
jgi:hypothetical protein